MHAWCFVAHTYCTYFTVMHWSEGGSCVCFVFVFAFQIVFVFGKQKEDFVFVVGIGVSIAAQIVCFHLIWFVLFNFDLSRFYLYLFPPLRHHWNCLIWLHHITLAPAESSLTARQISLRKTIYFIAYEKLFVTLLKYILLHICKINFCQNCMVSSFCQTFRFALLFVFLFLMVLCRDLSYFCQIQYIGTLCRL